MPTIVLLMPKTTMILKRVLSDIVFWCIANAVVAAAAGDVDRFMRDPRGSTLLIVLNILWLVPLVGDTYVRPAQIKVRGEERWYYLTMGVLLLEFSTCVYEFSRFRIAEPIQPTVAVLSGLAVIGGFTVSILAWLSIRRYSAPRFQIVEGHQLVDNGLYRFIRHPICLSFFLIALGITILLESISGLLVLVIIVTPTWLSMIRREEVFLRAHFGVAYETYKRRTKRLVPFVY
jgi:protein-S-isoprenylcysteine O-methyltransferase Ste14